MPLSPAAGPDLDISRRAPACAQPRFRALNRTRGVVLGDSIRRAGTSADRRKGLLGLDLLRAGEGLWIVPCEGIHTFGMRFAIDVLFIDRAGTVRKAVPCLKPSRISLCLRAHSVLELPAGMIEATGTSKGDRIELTNLWGGTGFQPVRS